MLPASFKKLYKISLIILFIPLVFFSCDIIKAVDDLVVPDQGSSGHYIIMKGEHSCNNGLKSVSTKIMRFEVTFDSSAVYQTLDPRNQGDINKLYGLSDCNSLHHTNSARFGWRWFNNRLEILAYTYTNQQRSYQFISALQVGKPTICELRFEENQYVFLVNEVKVIMPRFCTGPGEGYLLYPYFGGDEVAPHEIHITVKELL
ncbi:hypothetical protein ACSX1A_07445 [Pontibacter sp. MBLB2868]|uniref:hypothetical protein n=1 Tax=Pontibacter sp. MBLB2868 TaxID=3451555 RepID=UPI003F74D7BA